MEISRHRCYLIENSSIDQKFPFLFKAMLHSIDLIGMLTDLIPKVRKAEMADLGKIKLTKAGLSEPAKTILKHELDEVND